MLIVANARIFGGGFQIAPGGEIDDASIVTAFQAVPGALLGLAASYFWGLRMERHQQHA